MDHKEIIKKLIGNINPAGQSHTDKERFENLKVMCNLVNDLVSEIDYVAYHYRNDHQSSIKEMQQFADNFLTKTLGIKD